MSIPKIILSLILFFTVVGIACAESNDNVRPVTVPEKFYGIVINSNINVILSQTGENTIMIEKRNGADRTIKATVENGALVINGGDDLGTTLYVTVDYIELIEINGKGRLYVNGNIDSDILLLKVNGSGSMKLDVKTLSLGMIVKGSGKIVVSGNTGKSFLRIYGHGNIYKDQLDYFNCSEERYLDKIQNQKNRKGTLKLY